MLQPSIAPVWRLLALAAIFLGSALPARGGVPFGYTVTTLAPSATESLPYDINNNGQVIGYMFVGSATSFLYSAGQLTTLAAFQGSGAQAAYSGVSGINDSGQMAGSVNGQPILYSNGQTTSLGTVPPYPYGSAQSINNNGQLVGTDTPVISDDSQGRAYLHSAGQNVDLGVLPGYLYSYAHDINDNGQIAGASSLGDSLHYHPSIYSNGSMTDLGTLGGVYGEALVINASGAVAGRSMTSGSDYGSMRAFLYSSGAMHNLGVLPGTTMSEAHGINASGQVVGSTAVAVGQPFYHAFTYRNGTMTDLNSLIDPASGWTLVDAVVINDSGSIIGYGTHGGTPRQAFLLTPTPEPAAIGTLPMAAAALLARSRRTPSREESF
jgi:probable HAF family extracellular repeat protein